MEVLFSDVLIIGSGGAGLRAAIAARQKGLDVCVVGKGWPSRETCTGISGGAFTSTYAGFKIEEHLKSTLDSDRGLNNTELVDILVEESSDDIKELIDWGLRIVNPSPPETVVTIGNGPSQGREILRCLLRKAHEVGVLFKHGLTVQRIEAGEGYARLVAYSSSGAQWIGLVGRSVIIAAGGAGALYAYHDNPGGIMGDALALGYEAGATLQDLEFIQFHPLALAEPDAPPSLFPPRVADKGFLTNSRSEDVLAKYGITERPAVHYARDRVSQALFKEMETEGLDVFIDLTQETHQDYGDDASVATWRYYCDHFGADERSLKVAPVAHFFMGGISADAGGQTSVPGLFAVGEAATGLHGANRLSSNSLTETIVFGRRTGETAAAWAKQHTLPTASNVEKNLARMVPKPGAGKGHGNIEDLISQVQRIAWRHCGILRDRGSIEEGLNLISELAEETEKTNGATNPQQVRRYHELQSGIRVVRLMLEAAMRREESRGAHMRTDFPETVDTNWRGNLKVRLDAGQPVWQLDRINGQ